jgi:hypothetical protein
VLTADRAAAVAEQDAAVASTSSAPAAPAPVYKTVKQLRLRSTAAYLPHPEKESYGGEDAHFVSNVSGGAIGVADGTVAVFSLHVGTVLSAADQCYMQCACAHPTAGKVLGASFKNCSTAIARRRTVCVTQVVFRHAGTQLGRWLWGHTLMLYGALLITASLISMRSCPLFHCAAMLVCGAVQALAVGPSQA